MSAEENKLVVKRFWDEVVNEGSLDIVNELFAPNGILHDPSSGGFNGPDEFRNVDDNECAPSDSPWRVFMQHYKM